MKSERPIHKLESKLAALNHTIFDYLMICLVGLYVFTWFDGELLYFGGDASFPLNPAGNMRFAYTWNEDNLGSSSGYTGVRILIPLSFYYILWELGLPLCVIQRMLFYINYTLPGISMYFLASTIYPACRYKRLGCWIASLSYMHSPFLMAIPNIYLPWGFLPLCFATLIKGLEADLKAQMRYGLIFSISLLGVISVLLNYTQIIALLVASLFIILFYIGRERSKIRNALQCWVLFSVLSLLINAYVIVPLLYWFFSEGYYAFQITESQLFGKIPYSPMLLVLTATSNYSYNAPYFNPGPIIIIVNTLVTILAFSVLLFRNKPKWIFCFTVIFLIFALIGAGASSPAGRLFVWLLLNFAWFKTFRTVGELTIVLGLCISIFLGFTTLRLLSVLTPIDVFTRIPNDFCTKCKKAIRIYLPPYACTGLILASFLSLILIRGWPSTTGAIYRTYQFGSSTQAVDVPHEYFLVNDWLNNQSDIDSWSVLWVPGHERYALYDFGKEFYGPPMAPYAITHPVTFSMPSLRARSIYKSLSESNKCEFLSLIATSNIKYIIVDGFDLDSRNTDYSRILTHSEGVSKVTSFGKISIYELREELTLPRIYASSNLSVKCVVVKNEQNVLEFDKADVSLSHTKINPSMYKVHVNSSSPFWLILNTEYDAFWQAYYDDKGVFSTLVAKPIGDHVSREADGFGNAWFVDRIGNFTIILSFYPQVITNLSYAASFGGLLAGTFCLAPKPNLRHKRRGCIPSS